MSASSALATGLAEAFDRSFAALPAPAPQGLRDFVTIHLGAQSCAVALEEIAGIVPVARITRLPGGAASLLGAMGLKGDIVFVHHIARLLGVAETPPHWALLAATDRATAFAFEWPGGCLRLAAADIAAVSGNGFFHAAIVAGGQRRPVLSLRALLDRIQSRSAS